ncbi:MAG: M20 family metallo-hydrolase [Halobacteriales archaeon]
MDIDGDRLREDIEANAEFGKLDVEEGRGRTVLTGTDADRQARERLVAELQACGCEVRIDPVGNIAGRWVPSGADPDAAPVAAGSHLDSVPEGGIFDGVLGVYGALEAVRSIKAADVELSRPIEVIAFTEEEGQRFGIGTLGSSVAAGVRSVEEALQLTDEDGTTLESVLTECGFHGDDDIDPAGWDAWLELHVEQDTTLERTGLPVGIVDAITGITNCRAEIVGEANHAGATPMNERRDALTAASEFILAVEETATDINADLSDTAVGTVGSIDVSPNSRSIVPGRVEMRTDFRDVEYEAMNAIVDAARGCLDRLADERPVETEFERYRDQKPSPMSERCIEAAITAADAANLGHRVMHSAAMHDTANVADVTDTVLLFAPSKDGYSHNLREWTDWEDCRKATQVLAGAMIELAA